MLSPGWRIIEHEACRLLPPRECPHCFYGWIWIRPTGHTFCYPGGPALGMYGVEDYEKAEPHKGSDCTLAELSARLGRGGDDDE